MILHTETHVEQVLPTILCRDHPGPVVDAQCHHCSYYTHGAVADTIHSALAENIHVAVADIMHVAVLVTLLHCTSRIRLDKR